jgi:hypothetical protein
MKDKGQRTREGGTEDGKQSSIAKDRTSGIEPQKGDTGTLIDRVQRWGDKEQSCERGGRVAKDRTSGIEPQNGDTGTVDRQCTQVGRQGAEP